MSKQLRRLEQALGVTLFERGLRGIQPTEYGQALLPRARAIRAQARDAGEEVRQRRGSREGRLVVALSHFATIALLPRVVRAFRERWPGVQLSIVPPTFHLGGLREGAPDFAVMSMPAERRARSTPRARSMRRRSRWWSAPTIRSFAPARWPNCATRSGCCPAWRAPSPGACTALSAARGCRRRIAR
ncbi:LysR family transcriptional regulator [Ramlibacter terrae]|uniref:LysR family transcriptional regulator n=1 Tax=Ramlibacter terrae TaxID=2732511 RepID=A0ABX6P4J4_9BURK|nr:LysR family transcriptional regulator [Ramlibacter terrae]